MNKCTKFGANWSIFRSRTLKHFSRWLFRILEGLKTLQKILQANRRKKVMEFIYHNISLGRIRMTTWHQTWDSVNFSASYFAAFM